MKKMSFNPRVEYCEAARFIGKRIETEFIKLASLSSAIIATIANDEKLKRYLKIPFIQYLNTDRMTNGSILVTVGYIVDEDHVASSEFISGFLPAGEYVIETVVGPHDQLLDANMHIQEWADSKGLQFNKQPVSGGCDWVSRYELYIIGQESVNDPDKWETEIRYLLA